MRTSPMSLVGVVILAMLAGLGSTVLAQDETPGVSVEVLSDHGVIPGEAIPEEAVRLVFARTSIEPGVTGEIGSAQPHEWASLEYVQQGSLTVADNDRVAIWRADGTTEDLSAGTTASADAGDLVLFYDGGAGRSLTNAGPETFVTYSVAVGDSEDPAEPPVLPSGVDWQLLVFDPLAPGTVDLWFTRPVAVAFERLTFDPGSQLVLGSDEAGLRRLLALEAGRLESGFAAPTEVDGALNDSVRFIAPDADILTSRSFADDTVYVIRNESDEPAVVMSATLTNVDGITEAKPAD